MDIQITMPKATIDLDFRVSLELHSQVFQTGDQSGILSAYFFVNSSAFFINFFLSFVYSSAKSPRRGCSGSGECTRATRAWITEKGKFQEYFSDTQRFHQSQILYYT